jgi:hypothetical protein
MTAEERLWTCSKRGRVEESGGSKNSLSDQEEVIIILISIIRAPQSQQLSAQWEIEEANIPSKRAQKRGKENLR